MPAKPSAFALLSAVLAASACSSRGEGGVKAHEFVRVSDDYSERGGQSTRIARYELTRAGGEGTANERLGLAQQVLGELVERSLRQGEDAPLDPEMEPGDLLARIWSVFGPPGEGAFDEQFYYTFLDTTTHVVFHVSSWEAGTPDYSFTGTYDGPLPPPAQPDAHFHPQVEAGMGTQLFAVGKNDKPLRETALAFEHKLANRKLADCALYTNTDFGLHRIGARDGKIVDEKVSFMEAIDFYIGLVKRYGPVRDVPIYHLAKPQDQIRWLWSEASDAERALRPNALEYVRKSWRSQLAELAQKIILEERDQGDWELSWRTLDHDATLLQVSAEQRKELDALKAPPAVPKLTDIERGTLSAALWVKDASPHWTEAEQKEREASDLAQARENPEQDPVRIVQRLEASEGATERRTAALLKKKLFAAH